MSFNEKSAWFTLVALLTAVTMYWKPFAAGVMMTSIEPPSLGLLIRFSVTVTVLIIVMHAINGAVSYRRDSTRLDEREQLIELRANQASSSILTALVIISLIHYMAEVSFGRSTLEVAGSALFYRVLASVIVATLISSLMIIFRHRRGF